MSLLGLTGDTAMGTFMFMAVAWSIPAHAFDASICASLNTASMERNSSTWQTNGLCHDYCNPTGYAYAVTQGNYCWCSNYTPDKSTQVSSGRCNTDCPGYPFEKCGGPDVFGYVVANGMPSGTKGGSTPSSTVPSSTVNTSPPTSTSSSSSIPTSSSSSSSSSSDSTSSISTVGSTLVSPSTSSLQTSGTTVPTTETESTTTTTTSIRTSSVATVTADGTIKTVFIIPTETSRTSGDNPGVAVQESGLQTGSVVGIVVGVVGGVLMLAALIMFFYFRRKKQQQKDGYQDDPSIRGSSSGMMGSGRPDMARAPGSPGSTGNRSSLLPVDPRMDPFQQSLYARNGSRESVGTLRDDHDYSRRIQQPKVLRATNPDPDVN
ncbi:hypothetical protein C2857_000499 [Epichloe festucae Fl1]|uniref:WSC domain-containing protein n=1 Tax=Epichloe festucae (strain Fl1) TaxID=877507 RepID=A0A7S9PWU7_EPIFF|nr:hypothetical protein C2857_000499 [Epichloe festucae Fl1]